MHLTTKAQNIFKSNKIEKNIRFNNNRWRAQYPTFNNGQSKQAKDRQENIRT